MAVSTHQNWLWTFVIGGCAALAGISLFRIDEPFKALSSVLSFLLVYGIVGFIVFSLACRAAQSVFKRNRRPPVEKVDSERDEFFNEKKGSSRQEMQDKTNQKAERYKEEILKPREAAYLQRREQRLNNVLGKEFRGRGDALGGDVPDASSDLEEGANAVARQHRQLPDSVQLHIPADPTKQRIKQVITLPDEPDETEDDVVMVTIHTILDQRYSRRFLYSTQLQVIFDYMTTLGFSPRVYTLAWSHPRVTLTDELEKTLRELKFDKRTLLFVQELVADDSDEN